MERKKMKSNFKEGGGSGIVFEFEDADIRPDYEFDKKGKRGVVRYDVENLPIASYMNRKIVKDAGYIDIEYSPRRKSEQIDIIEMYGNYVASPGFTRAGVYDSYDISDSFGVAINPYGTEATNITFYPSDEFKAKYESIDDRDDEDDFYESKKQNKKLTSNMKEGGNKTDEVEWYSWAASYLINGDHSGLSDEDIKEADDFLEDIAEEGYNVHVVDASESDGDFGRPMFGRSKKAGDLITYSLLYTPKKEFKKESKKLSKKLSLKSYLEKKLTVSSKEAELIESVIKEYVRKKRSK